MNTGTEITTFKELDLSSYEDANSNGFKLIKADPILNGGLSLDKINQEFEEIHDAISHTPLARKMPSLTKLPLVGGLFKTSLSNKMSGFEGKLSNIFIAYDSNYESLINSSNLYKTQIKSLGGKLDKLNSHLEGIPLTTDNNKLYAHGVSNLISALTGTRTRMAINLDTAEEIRIQMHLNKPIFKAIIESLVIEKAGEVGLKAAQNSIDVMNKFIRKTSVEITDSTIAFSKEINANKYSVITSDIFNDNLTKLRLAMKDIAEIKNKAVLAYDKRQLANSDNLLKINEQSTK